MGHKKHKGGAGFYAYAALAETTRGKKWLRALGYVIYADSEKEANKDSRLCAQEKVLTGPGGGDGPWLIAVFPHGRYDTFEAALAEARRAATEHTTAVEPDMRAAGMPPWEITEGATLL